MSYYSQISIDKRGHKTTFTNNGKTSKRQLKMNISGGKIMLKEPLQVYTGNDKFHFIII